MIYSEPSSEVWGPKTPSVRILWSFASICGRILASILRKERQAMVSPFSSVRQCIRCFFQTVKHLLRLCWPNLHIRSKTCLLEWVVLLDY